MSTSDQIHNQNCQRYMDKLLSKTPAFIIRDFVKQLSQKSQKKFYYSEGKSDFAAICEEYLQFFPYGDFYTQFLTYLEDNIDTLYLFYPKKTEQVDACVDAVYSNDNGNLSETYQHIKPLVDNNRPNNATLEKKIAAAVEDNGPRINSYSPSLAGSGPERFKSTFLDDEFKPMLSTRLPTLPKLPALELNTIFYSFGTQAQRHSDEGKTVFRVSPLFLAWLRVQQKKENPRPHLYINNLGLDRGDFEGKKEKAMTEALHELNQKEDLNIHVITLPADKGLMNHGYFKKTTAKITKGDVFQELIDIALQNDEAEQEIKDFYLPQKLKKILFKGEDRAYSKDVEKKRIKNLLEKSFKRILPKDLQADEAKLSKAQSQAVWFDFLKFQLPNYIITELNPAGVNFSCKDAIDRGGVSLAYFCLMRSLEKSLKEEQPLLMTRDEFEKILHAAPTMVKGRGMNGHLQVIWNAIDCYVRQHHEQLLADDKAWLVEWRNDNCPHSRVDDVLVDALEFSNKRLSAKQRSFCVSLHNQSCFFTAQKIINYAGRQVNVDVSGKRLLLEVISTTPGMLFKPDKYDTKYQRARDDIECNYPKLKMLAGMMRMLMGSVLLIPTLGKSLGQVHKGFQTCKAAFYNQDRTKLVSGMQDLHFASVAPEA